MTVRKFRNLFAPCAIQVYFLFYKNNNEQGATNKNQTVCLFRGELNICPSTTDCETNYETAGYLQITALIRIKCKWIHLKYKIILQPTLQGLSLTVMLGTPFYDTSILIPHTMYIVSFNGLFLVSHANEDLNATRVAYYRVF